MILSIFTCSPPLIGIFILGRLKPGKIFTKCRHQYQGVNQLYSNSPYPTQFTGYPGFHSLVTITSAIMPSTMIILLIIMWQKFMNNRAWSLRIVSDHWKYAMFYFHCGRRSQPPVNSNSKEYIFQPLFHMDDELHHGRQLLAVTAPFSPSTQQFVHYNACIFLSYSSITLTYQQNAFNLSQPTVEDGSCDESTNNARYVVHVLCAKISS